MAAIATRALTKHYGAIRALDGVTLEVREGEIFGFLGPNGAGKSTFIRLLLGHLHPTAGSASVLGLDIVRSSVAIRGRIGYLPGGIALDDNLTGLRHLDDLAALSGRAPGRRAGLCDALELSDRVLRRPIRDYSRGMRQKVGIVQALQHDPELAILDEPSEGLDPLMQRAFYDILDGLRAAGRTVFFSSHVLSEVERVCDRVAIVRAGRLVEVDDVSALLERRRRRVSMRLGGPAPVLDSVPGVTGIVVSDARLDCSLEGDPRAFLAAIAGFEVLDLVIEPTRLEDAFLELYEGDEADEASGGGGVTGARPGVGPGAEAVATTAGTERGSAG